MVSKGFFLFGCYWFLWALAWVALWAAGAEATPARYDTATPHAPPYNRYKYIPLRPNFNPFETSVVTAEEAGSEAAPSRGGLSPPELILTVLRTALDVMRNINKNRAAAKRAQELQHNSTAIALRRSSEPRNGTVGEKGRGYYDEYDEHHDHETTTTAKPMKQGRYTDPWAGYYDWIINEGSFKFWSVFQLFTAGLLLYACLSAIYYAKFNPIIPDYDREYDDYFLERTVGRKARSLDFPSGLSWINSQTFQFILDAILHHYEEE